MNRRTLLAALPAAAVVPGVALADAETPVAALFQEWETARSAYNASDENDDSAEYARLCAVEDAILAATPRTAKEYAFKLLVLNDFAPIEGIPWGDAMMAEARALIG